MKCLYENGAKNMSSKDLYEIRNAMGEDISNSKSKHRLFTIYQKIPENLGGK